MLPPSLHGLGLAELCCCISAGTGEAGQGNPQERGGTDGAALACARPAPGSGNSADRGVEQSSTSGCGCSVLMYPGLCHCGSVALQLLFFLPQHSEHEGRARTVGKGHSLHFAQKIILCYMLPAERKMSLQLLTHLAPFCWGRKGRVSALAPEGGSEGTG